MLGQVLKFGEYARDVFVFCYTSLPMVDRRESIMRPKMWRDTDYGSSLVSFREIEAKLVN